MKNIQKDFCNVEPGELFYARPDNFLSSHVGLSEGKTQLCFMAKDGKVVSMVTHNVIDRKAFWEVSEVEVLPHPIHSYLAISI